MAKKNEQTKNELRVSHWINISGQPIDIFKEGFVYKITEHKTHKVYFGIKKFKKRIRRKPLKGKKRVRIDYVESDWKTYCTSSPMMQQTLADPNIPCSLEIIKICDTVTDMKASEAFYQLEYYMKGEWNQLVNEVINLRLRIR